MNNDFLCERGTASPSVPARPPSGGCPRPSLSASLGRAKEQLRLVDPVEARGLYGHRLDQAAELAMIMAEVYMMPPASPLKICGELLDGNMVREIFGTLTEEHALFVLEQFSRATYRIRNKKLYLRTSLYNAAFEMANSVANEVAVDMAGMKK